MKDLADQTDGLCFIDVETEDYQIKCPTNPTLHSNAFTSTTDLRNVLQEILTEKEFHELNEKMMLRTQKIWHSQCNNYILYDEILAYSDKLRLRNESTEWKQTNNNRREQSF